MLRIEVLVLGGGFALGVKAHFGKKVRNTCKAGSIDGAQPELVLQVEVERLVEPAEAIDQLPAKEHRRLRYLILPQHLSNVDLSGTHAIKQFSALVDDVGEAVY
jgi:hypothetical protein